MAATNDLLADYSTNNLLVGYSTNDLLANNHTNDLLADYSTNDLLANNHTNDLLANNHTNDLLRNYSENDLLNDYSPNEELIINLLDESNEKSTVENIIRKMYNNEDRELGSEPLSLSDYSNYNSDNNHNIKLIEDGQLSSDPFPLEYREVGTEKNDDSCNPNLISYRDEMINHLKRAIEELSRKLEEHYRINSSKIQYDNKTIVWVILNYYKMQYILLENIPENKINYVNYIFQRIFETINKFFGT